MHKFLGLCILALILLSGCQGRILSWSPDPLPSSTSQVVLSTDQLGDGGLISGTPCSAPCFYGVIEGQTKRNDVIRIFGENGIVDCKTYDTYISCPNIEVGFDKQLVTSLGFQPKMPVTLGKLVDKFGTPDHVAIIDRTFMAGTPTTDILLYYDNNHIVLNSGQHPGLRVNVDRDTLILAWSYTNLASYQAELSNWGVSRDPFPSHVSAWQGYGSYSP